MLEGDGPTPGEESASLITGPLYYWSRSSKDPELIERVAAVLRSRFEGESTMLRLADDLTKMVEDLRVKG